MKTDVVTIVVVAFLPLVVRTLLYFFACSLRSIKITPTSCTVIAGTPYLVSFLPLPLPQVALRILGCFLSMFLLTRYTEAELFPDGIGIPIAVELVAWILLDIVLFPLLASS